MPASLKFESSRGTETTNLQDTRIVTLEDTGGSIYILDITTNDLKVKYTPQGGQKVEKTINGLAAALGKLLTTDGNTPGKSVLAEEVAKKPVVDVLVPALTTGGTNDNRVYTKSAAETAFLKTADLGTKVAEKAVVEAIFDSEDNGAKISETKLGTTFAKIDASNLTDAANKKAFAEAILPAQDGKKSILVNKLGDALDRVQDTADDKVYGAAGHEKIEKDFLADKYPFAKTDGSNISTQADKGKALADAILAVQDGKKSILVNKLGEALDRVANTADDKVYGAAGHEKIAKDFLEPVHDLKKGIN